jgi:tRNA(adenine34) deaminase
MRACVITAAVAALRPGALSAPVRARSSTVATIGGAGDAVNDDNAWMAHALREAEKAFAAKEVPIGAVLVRDGVQISAAHNRVESLHDASAHAEMLCVRAASAAAATWRLHGTTLYCTVEPCAMCLAALHAFRVERLVYGAPNTRLGAIEGDMRAISDVPHPYHALRVTSGVRADDAAHLMREFFRGRREEPRYGEGDDAAEV